MKFQKDKKLDEEGEKTARFCMLFSSLRGKSMTLIPSRKAMTNIITSGCLFCLIRGIFDNRTVKKTRADPRDRKKRKRKSSCREEMSADMGGELIVMVAAIRPSSFLSGKIRVAMLSGEVGSPVYLSLWRPKKFSNPKISSR